MVGIQAGGREKEEEGKEEDLKQGFSKPIRDIKAWWSFIYVTAYADADFFRGSAERSFAGDFDKTFVNYVLKLEERRERSDMHAESQ